MRSPVTDVRVEAEKNQISDLKKELRGEKIDIVPWSGDTARFACNALSPAKVNKVIIDENNKSMEVIVDDDQLSLAIGRRGQNVRLASQLIEWGIDIKTEPQVKKEQNEVISLLMSLPNVNEVTANIFYNEGFRSLEDIAFTDNEALSKASEINDDELITSIQTAARLALKDRLEQMSVEVMEEEKPGKDVDTDSEDVLTEENEILKDIN